MSTRKLSYMKKVFFHICIKEFVNQFINEIPRETISYDKQINVSNDWSVNNLLPERFDTDRQVFMTEMLMKNKKISREEARAQITSSIAANRFGNPEELGATCAFLCSEKASFISGQNIQLDGGSYEGLF